MRTYGQFCPIARGSEILAERWTPIILRNLLLGCRTFNEIAAGAPGLSRALLARRLRELERAGVVEIRPKPNGRGSVYEPTPAGRDLAGVLESIGGWAERWTELTDDHADCTWLQPADAAPSTCCQRPWPRPLSPSHAPWSWPWAANSSNVMRWRLQSRWSTGRATTNSSSQIKVAANS